MITCRGHVLRRVVVCLVKVGQSRLAQLYDIKYRHHPFAHPVSRCSHRIRFLLFCYIYHA